MSTTKFYKQNVLSYILQLRKEEIIFVMSPRAVNSSLSQVLTNIFKVAEYLTNKLHLGKVY